MNRTDESGLPDELVHQLHRLAADETAGSRPFPRAEAAMRRRSPITRYSAVALAGAAALLVVLVEVFAGGAFHRSDQGSPAVPRPSATGQPVTPQQAGYPSKPVGSLAKQTAWLAALKHQVRTARELPKGGRIRSDRDVLIVAAGDVQDRARYADLFYRVEIGSREYWSHALWLGPSGAAADQMSSATLDPGGVGGYMTGRPQIWFVSPGPAHRPENAVVIVSGPQGQSVDVAVSRTFGHDRDENLTASTQYRAVPKVAEGLWADTVTKDEYALASARVTDANGVRGEQNEYSDFPGFDLTSVAAPGTDPADLEWLNGNLGSTYSVSTAEVPVYAVTAPVPAAPKQPEGQAAALLLRAPNGAHVVCISAHLQTKATQMVLWGGQTATDPGVPTKDVTAAIRFTHGQVSDYVVVAPEGATRVRVRNTTAPVRNRIAVLEVPHDVDIPPNWDGKTPLKTVPAEVLDQNGKVLARVTPQEPGEQGMSTAQKTPDELGDGTSVRP